MNPILNELISTGISKIGDTFANIVTKFKADPTKIAELEEDMQKARIEASLEAERIANQTEEIFAKELDTVNTTMREEGKSEHWAVWSWRPMIGFTFCAILINNYILLPYFKNMGMVIIDIPGEVWSAMLVILGAASAGRSFEKVQSIKNK